MEITDRIKDYHVTQKIVHWLMAAAIMIDLFVAQGFGEKMLDADRFESRTDHSQLGTMVAIFFLIRIFLRWRYGAPPLPETMPNWQKRAARLGHWGFYVLVACLIISGVATAMNANSLIQPFGLYTLSDATGTLANFLFFRGFHEFITNALITLIAIHILAAIYHLFFTRDGSTTRMLKVWKGGKRGAEL